MDKLCSILEEAQSIVKDDNFMYEANSNNMDGQRLPTTTLSSSGPMPIQATSADFAVKPATKTPTKTKKRSWKKPKDKPKRPLSAYNLFFQHEREKILSSISDNPNIIDDGLTEEIRRRRHRKTHGKIGFADLARSIAEKWKNIDKDSRKFFEGKAETEKARYKKELDAWMKAQKKKKNVKKNTDGVAAKNSNLSTTMEQFAAQAQSFPFPAMVGMDSCGNAQQMLQQQLVMQQQATYMQQKRLEAMLMQQQQAQQMKLMLLQHQAVQQQQQQEEQKQSQKKAPPMPSVISIPQTSDGPDIVPSQDVTFSRTFFDDSALLPQDDDLHDPDEYHAVSTVTTEESSLPDDDLNLFMDDFAYEEL